MHAMGEEFSYYTGFTCGEHFEGHLGHVGVVDCSWQRLQGLR